MGIIGITNTNLYKDDPLNNQNYGKTSWNDITDKPNEFNPSAHNHDTQYLNKDNTQAYTPEEDYNPAPKKYVDDEIRTAMTTNISKEIAFNESQYIKNAEYLISGDTTLSAINSEPIADVTTGLIINDKAQKITLQASNSGVKKVFSIALDLTQINAVNSADTDYLMFLFYIDSTNYAIFTGNLIVTFYSDSNENKGFSFTIAKSEMVEGDNIFKIKKSELIELGLSPELSSLDRIYISIDTAQASAVDFIINAILLVRKDASQEIANIFLDSDLNREFMLEAGEFIPGLDNKIYNISASVNGKITNVEDLSKGAINYNVIAKANNVCDGLTFKRGSNEFITMYINSNNLILRIVDSEGTILERTLSLGFTILANDEIIYRFNFNNNQINIYIHRGDDVFEDSEAIVIPEEAEIYYFGCITNSKGKLAVNYISNELNGIVKKDNSLQYGLNAEMLGGKKVNDLNALGTINRYSYPTNDPKELLCNGEAINDIDYPYATQFLKNTIVSLTNVEESITGGPIQTIHKVVYGNGIYVAIGKYFNQYGCILYRAENSQTWTIALNFNNYYAIDILFDGTIFYVSFGNGSLKQSNDGATWTDVSVSYIYMAMEYIDGCYYIGTTTGIVLKGTAINSLSIIKSYGSSAYFVRRIRKVNNKIVVITTNSNSTYLLISSDNGNTFTELNLSPACSDIIFDGVNYIMSSSYYYNTTSYSKILYCNKDNDITQVSNWNVDIVSNVVSTNSQMFILDNKKYITTGSALYELRLNSGTFLIIELNITLPTYFGDISWIIKDGVLWFYGATNYTQMCKTTFGFGYMLPKLTNNDIEGYNYLRIKE